MDRKCSECMKSFQEDGFYTHSSKCKKCHSSYNKAWYAKNQEKQKQSCRERKKINREAFKRIVQEAKSHPCSDCGKTYPYYVMDFDHLHSKRFEISQMLQFSESLLRAEMAKCEVVCSNCHRERTHKRKMCL